MAMSVSEFTESLIVPTGTQTDLRVDCYVRSAVGGPTAETITSIVDRLQRLCDYGQISTCQISSWPPERHTVNTHEPTRHGLIAEFERWADQHGVTLEPAFRRQTVPPSSLGISADDSRERIRVPIVALALYEDTPPDSDPETESLRGVVPYTDQTYTDTARTYTVDDWLSAVDPEMSEGGTHDTQTDHPSLLEGER